MKITPFRDMLFVELVESKERKVGSIIVQTGAKEKGYKLCKVIEVGDGDIYTDPNAKPLNIPLKKGDIIIISEYAGHTFSSWENLQDKYLFVSYGEILARWDDYEDHKDKRVIE